MTDHNYRRLQTNTETRLTSPGTAVPIHLTQLRITDRTKATDALQTNTGTRLTSPGTAVPIHLTQLRITDRTKATDVNHVTAPWTI